jgi:hypothetical protein
MNQLLSATVVLGLILVGGCAPPPEGDIFGPNCGFEPQGQIFFDKTFTLP